MHNNFYSFVRQFNKERPWKNDRQSTGLDEVVPVAAVVVMACNRADYLERTIKSILKFPLSSTINQNYWTISNLLFPRPSKKSAEGVQKTKPRKRSIEEKKNVIFLTWFLP